jgi:hypothetical protein
MASSNICEPCWCDKPLLLQVDHSRQPQSHAPGISSLYQNQGLIDRLSCPEFPTLSVGDFAKAVPTGLEKFPVSPFPAGRDVKAYISQFVAVFITQAKACGYRLFLALA